MKELCKRFNECYFPKDIADDRNYIKPRHVDKYINSCHYKGFDCEVIKLDDEEFKIFKRLGK